MLDSYLLVYVDRPPLSNFRGPLQVDDAATLEAAFPQDRYYVPPTEVIREEAGRVRGGQFNLIHEETGYKADLYPAGSDTLHRWALERRKLTELPGGPVWIAPPEYVILRKLEYFREGSSPKHMTDVRAMLEISGDSIDRTVLLNWIEKLRLHREWAQVGHR